MALASGYRRAAGDLATAQRDWPEAPVTIYLNGLVARGHAALYRRGGDLVQRVAHFYARDLPAAYRASWPFLCASAALLFGPATVAYLALLHDPGLAAGLFPPDLVALVHSHRTWTDIPLGARPYASGFIATNNIWVTILVFVTGIAFAIPTMFILIQNGIMLGAAFGFTQDYGVAGSLAAFVVGHGALELSIVVAAGAAGLMIGWALVQPGPFRRADAMVLAARRAFTLLIGLSPVLLVAGAIEGNISPSSAPLALKVLIGAATGALFYTYLLGVGRSGPQSRARSLSSR